jgi:hypothetical protein
LAAGALTVVQRKTTKFLAEIQVICHGRNLTETRAFCNSDIAILRNVLTQF